MVQLYGKMHSTLFYYIYQVQAIVDHHHGSDNARTATKVRFTEPNDAINEDEDEGSLEKVYTGIRSTHFFRNLI